MTTSLFGAKILGRFIGSWDFEHHKVMIPLLSAFDIDSTGAVLGFALASAFVWLLDFIFSFFRGYINFRTGAK